MRPPEVTPNPGLLLLGFGLESQIHTSFTRAWKPSAPAHQINTESIHMLIKSACSPFQCRNPLQNRTFLEPVWNVTAVNPMNPPALLTALPGSTAIELGNNAHSLS